MVSVTCESVTKILGNVKAVNRLELQIEPGELFFLLGPSGCGKTTVLRMIAGFYQPDEGRILFDGQDVSHIPPHKRNTGMVFQNYALWPHLDVWKNVEYGLAMRKVRDPEKHERVARVLDLVQMRPYAGRLPNQLSGGQQQRVALARALVIEPDVVLLDEPLSNLDAKLRLEMREQIKRIHHDVGRTMIYVTHDQAEALSMADRMAIMSGGQLAQVGSPRELYSRPQSTFVAAFIGETNMLAGRVTAIDNTHVIETATGLLRAASGAERVSRNDAVWCSIRPESLRLTRDLPDAADTSMNHLSGVVQSLMYLGSHEQYLVRLHDGTLVKAMDYNPTTRKAGIGDRITLACAPQDVVVLPQEERHDNVAATL